MVTPLAPTSQRKVPIGPEKIAIGTLIQAMPVYSCEVVALKLPISRSLPPSLPTIHMLAETKTMSNKSHVLVSRA